MNIQDSRILLKRATGTGVVPTIPVSDDHTDGSWLATDIYKGEIFINLFDSKIFTRVDSGIVEVTNPIDLSDWNLVGNTLGASTFKIGSLDNFDFSIVRNNIKVLEFIVDGLKFGTTAFKGTWKTALLTADRIYQWPDQAGTVAMTSDIPTNGWLKGGNTLGATSTLGSNDAFNWGIIHSGVELITVTSIGMVYKNSFGQPGTGAFFYTASTGRMVVGASTGSTSGGVQFSVYGATGGTALGLPTLDNGFNIVQYNGSFVYFPLFISGVVGSYGNVLFGIDMSTVPGAKVDIQTFTSSNTDLGLRLRNNSGTTLFSIGNGGEFKLNQGSDATGDTYYRDSSGVFKRLPIGTAGQVLTVAGGITSWATPSAGTITIDTTPIASGTAGQVLFESATNKISESANLFWSITNNSLYIGSSSGNTSALLDLISTTKGLGVPSMTTAQRDAITTPRDGLLIYDNDGIQNFCGRINGVWQNLRLEYTEAFTLLTTPGSASTWTVTTVTGAPANCLVDIKIEVTANSNRTFGARAVGSVLVRTIGVTGNVSNGGAIISVKTNASSQVELFTNVTANSTFTLMGYSN